jgi:hypothetical protein
VGEVVAVSTPVVVVVVAPLPRYCCRHRNMWISGFTPPSISAEGGSVALSGSFIVPANTSSTVVTNAPCVLRWHISSSTSSLFTSSVGTMDTTGTVIRTVAPPYPEALFSSALIDRATVHVVLSLNGGASFSLPRQVHSGRTPPDACHSLCLFILRASLPSSPTPSHTHKHLHAYPSHPLPPPPKLAFSSLGTQFDYYAAPEILEISPLSGPRSGRIETPEGVASIILVIQARNIIARRYRDVACRCGYMNMSARWLL